MRIVGGALKGRKLEAPAGRAVRPTSDRAREGLFNILSHRLGAAVSGARVLDLFAGSGALGLEALSRGAAQALLVDNAAAAISAIEANIAALGVDERATVLRADATRLGVPPRGGPFTLAFLDPPYGKEIATPVLETLVAKGWLADAAFCVVERSSSRPDPAMPQGFELSAERNYGAARILVLRRNSAI